MYKYTYKGHDRARVEQVRDDAFVPNSLHLDDARRMVIITGPNMGGKSTYMRQVAHIVLMAHTGSFVPADAAQIGPIDQIFTRIGASDDLAGGRSTFMVEMTEIAFILSHASPTSLVLVDEIGRGTSTFDGLALAWACAIELATRIQCHTLFSTHYFELTELPTHAPSASNVHLEAVEHAGTVTFLYQVQPGPADRSYGLQVARLAGIPETVLEKARTQLEQLEQRQGNLAAATPVGHQQMNLFGSHTALLPERFLDKLRSLDPDQTSPREALSVLYELRALIGEQTHRNTEQKNDGSGSSID